MHVNHAYGVDECGYAWYIHSHLEGAHVNLSICSRTTFSHSKSDYPRSPEILQHSSKSYKLCQKPLYLQPRRRPFSKPQVCAKQVNRLSFHDVQNKPSISKHTTTNWTHMPHVKKSRHAWSPISWSSLSFSPLGIRVSNVIKFARPCQVRTHIGPFITDSCKSSVNLPNWSETYVFAVWKFHLGNIVKSSPEVHI